MGQSNQRLRENTYENLQNMMLERQDAESASNFGMGNTPGMSGENPMNSMIGEGGNTGGMGGTEMNPVDFSNNLNAILGGKGMEALTNDTQNLMKKQEQLVGTMKKLEPMIGNAQKMIEGLNIEKFSGLFEQFAGKSK